MKGEVVVKQPDITDESRMLKCGCKVVKVATNKTGWALRKACEEHQAKLEEYARTKYNVNLLWKTMARGFKIPLQCFVDYDEEKKELKPIKEREN